jgi:hypothetical protein
VHQNVRRLRRKLFKGSFKREPIFLDRLYIIFPSQVSRL